MSKKRRDKDFLEDIQEAINLIGLYTKGLTYRKFLEDRKVQDAVVRNLEVIGEASKNIAATFKAKYPDVPWKKVAGLRDKLIHFYFGIDYKIVWNIAKKELPKLLKQVKAILKQESK
ncbi:MAG: DUF86 domain-containing protein [Deltaproteobacteria bacterium]|nr:DUF86 domain-containing protein [Deltaproteobacteria bacterium]